VAFSAKKNTVAYQLQGRPLMMRRDLSATPMHVFADQIDHFRASATDSMVPEKHALWFYLANHAMHCIAQAFDPYEPLPDPVLAICEEYHDRAARSMLRAVYYVAVITAREARHLENKSEMQPIIAKHFGQPCADALKAYKDTSEISNTMSVFRNNLKDVSIGDFAASLQYTHYYGSYSSSFGGPAWGQVTDPLVSFVRGHTTAEMFLDTVWTLAHNGGPIFNKGMLYNNYGAGLYEILDVQRSGQIPALVRSKGMMPYPYPTSLFSHTHVDNEMIEFARRVHEEVPGAADFARQPVDWIKVHELGSMHPYSKYMTPAQQKAAPPFKAGKKPKVIYPAPLEAVAPPGPGVIPPVPLPNGHMTTETHVLITQKIGVKKIPRKVPEHA